MAHTVGGFVSTCTVADLPSAATCRWVFPTSTSPKARTLAVPLASPLLPHAATARHNAASAGKVRAVSVLIGGPPFRVSCAWLGPSSRPAWRASRGVLVATILYPAFFPQKTVDEEGRGGYRQVRGYLENEAWWIEGFGGIGTIIVP